MRNNIYRNFLKKVLKSEAFVSLAIVFVLALGIIGTSYALYMDVDTDTDYQLVKVGDLDVYIGFDNGDNTFSLSNVTPTDDEIALKSMDNIFSFYIYNGGNYTANYSIKLVPDYSITDTNGNAVTPNEIKPEYIRFQICKDNARNCKDVEKLSDYVTVDEDYNITATKEIYVDELSPKKENDPTNPSAYYFIRMWLTSEGYGTEEYDTNVIGKTIKYKVNVEAKNASGLLDNQNTLAGKLLSDDRVTINNNIPDFSVAETEEKGMYKAEDDYGITYYYRGKQPYNYVNFAGFTWRVVRINGDGSIRLVLNGGIPNSETKFNLLADDNAYVGYMYGEFEGNSASYEEAHDNKIDSAIKQVVDNFYETYLENDSENKHYGEYLADTIFCGDKTAPQQCFGKTYCSYNSMTRLYWNNIPTPTYKCAEGESYDYSRYTVDAYTTSKGIQTNGDLKYPIALLSADDVVFSGVIYGNYTYSNYLDSTLGWLLGAASFDGSYACVYGHHNASGYPLWANSVHNGTKKVSPVINLKSDVLWASGDGTIDTPYEVKLY